MPAPKEPAANKEWRRKLGERSRAAGHFKTHPEVGDLGRKAQHAIKTKDGKSVSGVNAGRATAELWGRTKGGKSISGLYRIHCRWGTPVKDPEARKVLTELGKLDEEGRPIQKDQ